MRPRSPPVFLWTCSSLWIFILICEDLRRLRSWVLIKIFSCFRKHVCQTCASLHPLMSHTVSVCHAQPCNVKPVDFKTLTLFSCVCVWGGGSCYFSKVAKPKECLGWLQTCIWPVSSKNSYHVISTKCCLVLNSICIFNFMPVFKVAFFYAEAVWDRSFLINVKL